MLKFYSENDHRKIKEAHNYQDMLAVATNVIARMHYNTCPPRPIFMFCGPIGTGGKGSRKENLTIFSRAIERGLTDNIYIFSQMPFEDAMDRIYKSDSSMQGLRLLEEFYKPIFETGFIQTLCFMSGWQTSVGAKWEHEQAKKLRIPIIYLSEYYTND